MNTAFLLMDQYRGKAVIPAEEVCRDYLRQYTPAIFIEKIRCGELKLPLVELGTGQKSTEGVALNDLAEYLDRQIEDAWRNMEAMRLAHALTKAWS
jgi:Pyocin activator protein PrtN